MATVFLTGAAGFIGTAVTSALHDRGHHVVGTDVADGLDLRDTPAVCAAIDASAPVAVIHLGGVSGPMLLEDDPAHVVDINCVGTANVLAASHRAGVATVVYAASVAAYAHGTSADPRPDSVYAVTKRFGEDLVDYYRRHGHRRWTSVRVGSVYGTGRVTSNPIMEMIARAQAGEPVVIDPRAVEPLVHVDDCGQLLAGLIEVSEPAACYELVERVANHSVIAEIVVHETLSPSTIVLDEPVTAPPSYPRAFDVSNLLRDTGRRSMVSLEEGVRRVVRNS
ncbi:MAG: NAD(P)-dependent oxidoreductase [Actinomycetota bacterium]